MSEDRSRRRLARMEAALYSAGRPVSLEDLKRVVGTKSDKVIQGLIQELTYRYRERGCAMEVSKAPEDRVILKLRDEYDEVVNRFNHRPLLSRGPLRTLSYVAYHQPVEQTQVVADRGSHAYGHLRMMDDMGLITRERNEDRTYVIRTTSFFADYFGFSRTPAKSKLQLHQIFGDLKIHRMDNGDGEHEELADPRDRLAKRVPQYARASD